MANRLSCIMLVIGILPFATAGVAAESLSVGGADARLDQLPGPRASLILIPGAGGLSQNDPLQRASGKYAEKGFAVLSVDKTTQIRAAMRHMAGIAKPVYVAGVSAGVRKIGNMVAGGKFKTQGLVLVSGNLQAVREKVGQPGKLPRTLVVHHRNDGCTATSPDQVAKFKKWAGDKVTVRWLEGGDNDGDPCGPRSYHGLAGLDDAVVDAIADFLR
ncbi:MAG: hypothetical protein O2967_21095 [Proteobacteria bacterium]|nr:hypothetical protein [Pseudomonadota bacterium]